MEVFLDLDNLAFTVALLGPGLGGTIIGSLSYFRKFKKISRKWFLGGLTASSTCASIGIAAWVIFTMEYFSPPPPGVQFHPTFSNILPPIGPIPVGPIIDLELSLFASGFAEVMHEIVLQGSFFMGTYCMVLGTFGIVSCVRALITRRKAGGKTI